jgi:DNA-binding transcriptional MerR regulator
MLIGELARRCGVNVQAIRFYERRELLRKPLRLPSGYRSYDDSDLEDVLFIKQSQELGFTLQDIKALLRLHGRTGGVQRESMMRSGEQHDVITITQERLEVVRAKLRALKAIEGKLCAALERLREVQRPICPGSTRAVRDS